MTADQLTLGDCDPMWHDWDQLCARGADASDPAEDLPYDLRHQGLSGRGKHRIVDVEITGEWL